jgi:hypothetical protein
VTISLGSVDSFACGGTSVAQRDAAIIAIDSGEVLDGDLPRSKMKLVQAWIEIHREELLANWRLVVEGQQPFKIEPLK